MNAPTHSFPVPLAFVILLVLHTVVSIGACRWMAKPTVLWETAEQPPVETTTPEQEARGEKSFMIRKQGQFMSPVPVPVLCYVFAGYAGLGLAAVIAVFAWIRQGHA